MCMRVHRFGLLMVVALALLWGGAARGQAAEAFCLTASQMPISEQVEGEDWLNPDPFYRELVRQAVLLVARDMFGLSTRDMVLREPMPGESGSLDLFEIQVAHGDGKYLEYSLMRGGALIYENRVPYLHGRPALPWQVLDAVLNDTLGPMQAALREAGLEPVRLEMDSDGGGATEAMEAALNRMELASQYTAVRLAHAAIREQGYSLDLLSVLVRGYANLSQLTAFHADSARYVFAARALLYAARVAQMGDGYPMAYWLRAYASQLFGMTREAAWDLALAAAYVDEHPGGPEPPTWVELVELGSRYRYAELRQIVETESSPHQDLAALLWFRSVETCSDNHLVFETGVRVWEDLSHCMRLTNGMMRVAYLWREEQMATVGFEVLAETMPESLELVVEYDPTLGVALDGFVEESGDLMARSQMTRALVQMTAEGGDVAEPSLAVLSRLIEEQEFVLIVSLAEFITYTAKGNTGELLDAVAPVVAGHPHAELLQTLRVDGRRASAEVVSALIADYVPAEGNPVTTMDLMLRLLWRGTLADGTDIGMYRTGLRDYYSKTDLECYLRVMTGDPSPLWRGAVWIQRYHPDSPWAYSYLLAERWDHTQQFAQQWEQAHGSHPAVARALADHYYEMGREEEAGQLYEVYRSASPDFEVYDRLARIAWRAGDYDRVEAIVEESLGHDSYGLEYAWITQDLAHSYMSIGDYEKALPWAQYAARSNSGWALLTLGNCLEALGRLEESQEVFVLMDRQYGTEHAIWQLARTCGDMEEARPEIVRLFDQRFGRDYEQYPDFEATMSLLMDHHEDAMRRWDAMDYATGVPFRNCMVALMALRAGNEDVFLQKLEETTQLVAAEPYLAQETYIALAGELLSMHGGEPLQEEALAQVIRKARGEDVSINNIYLYLAIWYDHQGDAELAVHYYKLCAASRHRLHRTVLYSCLRLRELGEHPSDVQIEWGGFGEKERLIQR